MKYLARIALIMAIGAVGLVTFYFAASVEAGNAGVHVSFHCQGPDVYGKAIIDTLPAPQKLTCSSLGWRVANNDPPASTGYSVTLEVWSFGWSLPDNICQAYVFVGDRLRCESPFGPQTVTIQIR